MRTYLRHLIHTTWFTLTWELVVSMFVFFIGISGQLLFSESNFFLNMLSVLTTLSAIFALTFIPLVELTKNYWKTLYRVQGLFTHTLPISKGKIFIAHGIWFTICSFIWNVILILAIFTWVMVVAGRPSSTGLAEIQNMLFTHWDTVLFYILNILVSTICGIFIFFAAISVGMHSKIYSRLGIAGPILSVLLVTTIGQIIILIGTFIIPIMWSPQNGIIFKNLVQLVIEQPSGADGVDIPVADFFTGAGGIPIGGLLVLIPFTIFICYLAIRFLNRNLSVSG